MIGRILVLGATGTIGAPLVAALVAGGQQVRAASRQAASMPGAEPVHFDYADPSTIAPAFEGVDRVFVLVPAGTLDIVGLVRPVLQEAARRKVKVVLLSVLGADADDNIPYRQLELSLERGAVPFVILRPNWFADNFHTFWRAGVSRGVIAVPAADGKSSFIDARDIAASAAAALASDRFDGKAFNLTGPQALSYAEAAAILSRALGREIVYTAVDDRTFIDGLVAAGLAPDYAAFLASIFHPVREGWTAGVTGDVQALTGRLPRPLEVYAADHVGLWG
ncbi:MAG: SDR family oxidoreductase [Proteobacteria bacterium]|nr:SDR family oxidoreductase [Pseudomonadota bacterium]